MAHDAPERERTDASASAPSAVVNANSTPARYAAGTRAGATNHSTRSNEAPTNTETDATSDARLTAPPHRARPARRLAIDRRPRASRAGAHAHRRRPPS